MSTASLPLPAQSIAGVTPAQVREVAVMTVWPSVAKYGIGRAMGQAFAVQWPNVYIFKLGNLLALLSIPVALPLFFLRIAPFVGTRYVLTNRRLVVLRGIVGKEEKSVDLDRFDTIDIVVEPGQAWYEAGDLVFRLGTVETFKLEGVSRPAAFRATCLKSQIANSSVKKAQAAQRR